MKCPPLDPALIAYLEETFPDRACDPARMDPQRHYGNVEVVRHLKAQLTQQEENPDVYG